MFEAAYFGGLAQDVNARLKIHPVKKIARVESISLPLRFCFQFEWGRRLNQSELLRAGLRVSASQLKHRVLGGRQLFGIIQTIVNAARFFAFHGAADRKFGDQSDVSQLLNVGMRAER